MNSCHKDFQIRSDVIHSLLLRLLTKRRLVGSVVPFLYKTQCGFDRMIMQN